MSLTYVYKNRSSFIYMHVHHEQEKMSNEGVWKIMNTIETNEQLPPAAVKFFRSTIERTR